MTIQRGVFRYHWDSDGGGSRFVKVEVLADDVLHVEVFERWGAVHPHHRELAPTEDAMWVSPMIDEAGNASYSGPSQCEVRGVEADASHREVRTAGARLELSPRLDCLALFAAGAAQPLAVLRPTALGEDVKRVHIERLGTRNVYGAGNLFLRGDEPNGDWVGERWDARGHGNFRTGLDLGDTFHGGWPSISQVPLIYLLGEGHQAYALFFDQPDRVGWNFQDHEQDGRVGWSAALRGDEVRFYLFLGDGLPSLRRAYLRLTGRPPLPPKSVLGYWTSEFGYNDWGELGRDLESLRANDFPVDGAALDLQWFGGTFGEPAARRMGSLSFWEQAPFSPNNSGRFERPAENIKRLHDEAGIHLMTIEESYVDSRLREFAAMANPNYRQSLDTFRVDGDPYQDCYLARVNLDARPGDSPWEPVYLTTDYHQRGDVDTQVWWGGGGMIDWSNPAARRYWHHLKRRPLGGLGIFSYWMDLGEPEMFFEGAWYHGLPGAHGGLPGAPGRWRREHRAIHNLYNFFWAQGVDEGLGRTGEEARQALCWLTGRDFDRPPRHFVLARAGTAGSQRYSGLWSGDLTSNFENLRGHLHSQVNMSLLGFDLYSADAGGFFHDGRPPEDPFDDDIVTQWVAAASLLDIPLRTHAWADGEVVDPATGQRVIDFRFGLDVRGHRESNRANVRRRYELIPYSYSLLYRAHLYGDAVFPPLVYHFPEDLRARTLGDTKMIGEWLLLRTVSTPGASTTRVYLPAGTWIDYESHERVEGGRELDAVPLWRKQRVPTAADPALAYFLDPLFVRAGAIIPTAHVDARTMNSAGRRTDGAVRDELILQVFADRRPTALTLYEDDGLTVAYRDGGTRTTRLGQLWSGDTVTVTVEAAQGTYVGAPARGALVVVLEAGGATARCVTLGAEPCVRVDRVVDARGDPDDEVAFAQSIAQLRAAQKRGWYHAGRDGLIRAGSVDRLAVDAPIEVVFTLAP